MWDHLDKPCKPPHSACDVEREKCSVMRDLENIKSRIISELERYKCHIVSELCGIDGDTQRKLEEIIKRYDEISKRIQQEFCDLDVTAKAYYEHAETTISRFERQIMILNTLELEMLGLKRTVASTIEGNDKATNEKLTAHIDEVNKALLEMRAMLMTVAQGKLPDDVVNSAVANAVDAYLYTNANNIATKTDANNDRIVADDKNRDGVYALRCEYSSVLSEHGYEGILTPAPIPKGGISVRNTGERTFDINGETYTVSFKANFYINLNGTYVDDPEMNEEFSSNGYTARAFYVPYRENRAVGVKVKFLGSDSNPLVIGENEIALSIDLLERVKKVLVYGGEVKKGSGLIGSTPATVNTNEKDEGIGFSWNFLTFAWKYACLTSVVPLKYVDKITVNPDLWIVAKIYHFDPVHRTSTWKATRNLYTMNPVYGAGCVVDFSDCGNNDYAIIGVGKVPLWKEYDSVTRDGSAYGTANIGLYGLNRDEIEGKICVHWKNETRVANTLAGTSLPVVRNMNLLKSLSHATATALYGNDTSSKYMYLYGKNNFAGVFYGGSYIGGTFFYNVSPVTYFTSLLNPNSNAYGDCDTTKTGVKYGIRCSAFTSLLHGHPIPRSTFDYRYNRIEGYEISPFSFTEGVSTLKKYDVLCQGAGQTGHCVMVSDVINIGDEMAILKVVESTTPATGENIFVIHNGVPYVKPDAEKWYEDAYDFVARYKPEYDRTIHDKAVWEMPYTTPQKVMCARGYGSIHVLGKEKVLMSVATDVAKITVYKNLEPYATHYVENLAPVLKNGYNLVELPVDEAGEYAVYNDVDGGVEMFIVVDASMYAVNAEYNEERDEVVIYTTHNERVKYFNVVYECMDGSYVGEAVSMCYTPEFVDGKAHIPATYNTDIGTWRVRLNNFGDSVNAVFETNYDTNTFWVDAEGDRGV